jgi:tetratricopeptide (TPR) repeat protein
MELIRQAPLFGHGLESFALLYPQYHQLGQGEAQYVHNWPLEVLLEMGIAGLTVFGWWIFSIFRLFNERLNAAQDAAEERVLLVLMSGVSAILLQSLFDFNTDLPVIFAMLGFFLGALSGTAAAGQQQADARPPWWCAPAFRTGAGLLLAGHLIFSLLLPYYAQSSRDAGMALVAGDERVEATPLLERAARLNPWSADYRNTLGNHYLALGQPERALETLREAVDRNPMRPRYHFDLFRALRQLKRQNAGQAIEQAHQLHPSSDEYLTARADWLEQQGKADQARQLRLQAAEVLRDAIEANPGKADYHRRLANVLETLGREDEAQSHRQQAEKVFHEILQRLRLNSSEHETSPVP